MIQSTYIIIHYALQKIRYHNCLPVRNSSFIHYILCVCIIISLTHQQRSSEMYPFQQSYNLWLNYSMHLQTCLINQWHQAHLAKNDKIPMPLCEIKTKEEDLIDRHEKYHCNAFECSKQSQNFFICQSQGSARFVPEGLGDFSINREEEKKIQTKKINKRTPLKENRNTNSNLLRMFFRFVERLLSSENEKINIIISKHKLKTSLKKFEEWYEINKADRTTYIRLPAIRPIFFGKKSSDQTKLMRILLSDFLRNLAHAHYLTSNKIKRTAMKINLLGIRNLIADIHAS